MHNLAHITLDQLAAQRHSAAQAARPDVTPAQRAQDLADRMIAAIKADRRDEAKRIAIELRPMLGLLPEGS